MGLRDSVATRVAESQRRLQLTANTVIAALLTADEKEKKRKNLCSGLHSLKIKQKMPLHPSKQLPLKRQQLCGL